MSVPHFDAVVVGAGLAGLAAASALSSAGGKVLVLERKPFVGGRAYSYEHPALHEEIDCQHVLLGCCTNLVHLCEQAGVADRIRWYDELTFLEPGLDGKAAQRTSLKPRILPAPLHTSFDFLRAPMLGLADKVGIARGLMDFMRGYPAGDSESFATWLKRTRQTPRAIKHLWEPVIVGALNDGFENCSTKYAGQVFHESFLKSAQGGRLGIPAMPLSQFYGYVAEETVRQGAELRLSQSVTGLAREGDVWSIATSEGSFTGDNVVLAVPFQQAAALLPMDAAGTALREQFSKLQNAPITTVHLWFEREITELDHAALLDTGIQWIFQKSRIRKTPGQGSYCELTISASFAELHQTREEILGNALRELAMFFPKVREVKLVKSGILKEARATFSVTPGLDASRPTQTTAWPGLFLAGDWTETGWPSTMEGAVRGGYLAAGAVAGTKFLRPDLPATGLTGLIARS
ncbi:squalene-associated FAD-dependent desaturase [Terriglobus roseus DSM 18391]|uniref:Squalene-associated FAD-dependent desaturase n=1 Tax=Terriglobus roseus (strain DSM 18391 / NRRL B-41598 / KBS 63) TaxID=926566 RepID=I3ZFZ3_TERRK|nr:hydroxysqualene dehydroxylase HpnE [Terriglobus roseus]AFL88161.1 squalene-associated FAD-dependent desaturase [Terriglobus roseus DSM 18391]